MALEGTLSYLDISHLLQVVGTSKKSGVLEIRWEEREASLFFQQGRLIRAESNRFHEGLGTLLVRGDLLRSEELDRALATQRSEGGGRKLGAILCDEFGIRADDIERVLQTQFQRIVYDVFSWPGGRFVFHFQEPGHVLDRFNLNPVDFILEVGIQAGLLAQEGVERETGDPCRPPLLLLLGDRILEERCCTHMRRRGHRVAPCRDAAEVLARVEDWASDGVFPVVIAEIGERPAGGEDEVEGIALLGVLQAGSMGVPVVALGGGANPSARMSAQARGVRAYVRKPLPEDLAGPQGETHLDVFLISLAKAVEMAVTASQAAKAGARA